MIVSVTFKSGMMIVGDTIRTTLDGKERHLVEAIELCAPDNQVLVKLRACDDTFVDVDMHILMDSVSYYDVIDEKDFLKFRAYVDGNRERQEQADREKREAEAATEASFKELLRALPRTPNEEELGN